MFIVITFEKGQSLSSHEHFPTVCVCGGAGVHDDCVARDRGC